MYQEKSYVSQCREMVKNQKWCEHSIYRKKVNSFFAKVKNWDGLVSFYNQVIELANMPEQYIKTLRLFEYSNYENLMFASFNKAKVETQKDSTVKAIYFEYDDGQANFFLCQRYSNKGSDWITYWHRSIECPKLAVDVDLFADDLSNFHQLLVTDYLNARVCVAVGKAINGYSKVPVAMAEHDHSIVYLS